MTRNLVPLHKPRRAPRAAFVATVSIGAAAAACDETVTNPPFVEYDCPAELPEEGTECDDEYASCDYGINACGVDIRASCHEGAWHRAEEPFCEEEPAPRCPTLPPADDQPCEESNYCVYTDPCGGVFDASCDGSVWHVRPPEEPCVP